MCLGGNNLNEIINASNLIKQKYKQAYFPCYKLRTFIIFDLIFFLEFCCVVVAVNKNKYCICIGEFDLQVTIFL